MLHKRILGRISEYKKDYHEGIDKIRERIGEFWRLEGDYISYLSIQALGIGITVAVLAGAGFGLKYVFDETRKDSINRCQSYVERIVQAEENISPKEDLLARILCDSRCYRTELSDQMEDGFPKVEAHQHAVQECFYKNIAKGGD